MCAIGVDRRAQADKNTKPVRKEPFVDGKIECSAGLNTRSSTCSFSLLWVSDLQTK